MAPAPTLPVGRATPTSDIEIFHNAHRPKIMYHPTKASVQVFSRKEIEELGPEWSETYMYQEYPKCKYHWSGKTVTVKNRDEEVALGGGWSSLPGAFDPYKEPAQVRPKDPNPLKWIDRWAPTLQPPESRRKLMAALLKAHAAFWKLPEYPSATVDSIRQAFNGIAQVLFDAGLLTEEVLKNDVTDLVWDSAVAGGWWHLASETQQDIFPQQSGHYWVWFDESHDWPALFRGLTAEWTAKLLESSQAAPAASARKSEEPWITQATVTNSTAIIESQEGAPVNVSSAVGSPEDRLQSFIRRHSDTTYADIKYSAKVHTAEFQDWRRGELKSSSKMSLRIEDVLSGKTPLTKKPGKRRDD